MKFKFVKALFYLFVSSTLVGIFALAGILLYFSYDLPSHEALANYNPPTISRVYTKDFSLVEEYAYEKRIYANYEEIPRELINAFLAAEDKNFFHHSGIDFSSIFRAAAQNFSNYGENRSLAGGSTITQQLVKNFLLTNEQTYKRKIKEAILSYRISDVYSKEKVLELYLNQVNLGGGSYGVLAASLNYFNKNLDELTTEEMALLAAMPKAPSRLNPRRNYEKALNRRNWVLSRMFEDGHINKTQFELAVATPINLQSRRQHFFDAKYYSEEVRQEMVNRFGKDEFYEKGYSIITNIDDNLQEAAKWALQKSLKSYTQRHGWKGAIAHHNLQEESLEEIIEKYPKQPTLEGWSYALVLEVEKESLLVLKTDSLADVIEKENLKWVFNSRENKINSLHEIITAGDVVFVSTDKNNQLKLEQRPKVNGAIVVLEPHTGRVLAMQGGYDFGLSKFNRATQAERQPGSSFKPFIYLLALENGYEPNTLISDEAVRIKQGKNMPTWVPKNYEENFLGQITLRRALEKSRNIPTIRLASNLGIEKLVNVNKRFGINNNPDPVISLSLGVAETTLLKLTNAYNTFASGGMKTTPRLISAIYDNKYNKIFEYTPQIPAYNLPKLQYCNEKIVNDEENYQMIHLLMGTVKRGTGWRALSVGKNVAVKTGTTNDGKDGWYLGFNKHFTVGVYVGFDEPQDLGKGEAGSSVAGPVFVNFMRKAMKKKDGLPFDIPQNIEFKNVDINTGRIVADGEASEEVIEEALRKNLSPTETVELNDDWQQKFSDIY